MTERQSLLDDVPQRMSLGGCRPDTRRNRLPRASEALTHLKFSERS